MENRMNSLGVNEMVFQQYKPIDEVISDIDKVTVKSVKEYVSKYVHPDETSLMIMGDLVPKEALNLLNVWED
jgi:predicted Zn-dependent peptidase